ncbi:unnamed protein product [Schistocephalus solidus]|uniref:Pleckstrin homology-like domain family B member 2 n=1 Tax=Schistocephalus solidus TaxID=70667 RepID=A0A183TPW2_SCHSO|nr:unnamed protein product [Schistocephalus solidus]
MMSDRPKASSKEMSLRVLADKEDKRTLQEQLEELSEATAHQTEDLVGHHSEPTGLEKSKEDCPCSLRSKPDSHYQSQKVSWQVTSDADPQRYHRTASNPPPAITLPMPRDHRRLPSPQLPGR